MRRRRSGSPSTPDGSVDLQDATSGDAPVSQPDAGNADATNHADATDHDAAEQDVDAAPAPLASSCKAILDADPSSTSGTYTIDPDGLDGPLGELRVHCDMAFDGGGWTLIFSTLAGLSLDAPGDAGADAGTNADFYHRPPAPNALGAFKGPVVAALAEAATTVHIRTPFEPDAEDAGAYITSTTLEDGGVSLPMHNLRVLKGLNVGGDGGFATEWTGPNANGTRLDYVNSGGCSGVESQVYPALYWACDNPLGLHLAAGASRWIYDTGSTPNEAMEVYVR